LSIPLQSVEIGKCYLLEGEPLRRVRLVTHILPSGRIRFEGRDATESREFVWAGGTSDLSAFAEAALHEVPCDWTPDTDEV
jgi:hypothetical protein